MCIYVWMGVRMNSGALGVQKGVRYPGAGVTGSHEMFNNGVRYQPWVLCQSSPCPEPLSQLFSTLNITLGQWYLMNIESIKLINPFD